MCLRLDITSKESVQGGEEVGAKLVGGPLDVLIDKPEICYTVTAIDTEFEIVAAGFDTQGCLERPT